MGSCVGGILEMSVFITGEWLPLVSELEHLKKSELFTLWAAGLQAVLYKNCN